MWRQGGKRLGCLLLLGFAVGCGSEESDTTVDNDPPTATASNEDNAAPAGETIGSEEVSSDSVAESDHSDAQMPELLVPVQSASVDPEVQPAAAIGLPRIERLPLTGSSPLSGANALAELVEAYRTGQPEQWTRAETAIHAQGAAALPALCEGLGSTDRQTRELASMMLAQVLPNLLYAENPSQRSDVLLLAGKLRPALKDESAEVRVNVAVALSLMEGEGQSLVPVLQELLTSELPHVRTIAVSALGGIGTPAAIALPQIERLSQTDSDPNTKAAALEALKQLRSLQ